MSRSPHPVSDEDLSAIIDGEADDALRRRVESDPSAVERLRSLQAASELLRTPPPPLEPATVDRLVARALEEASGAGSAEVTPLPRRASAAPAAPRWLVAAVVVALAAIGLGLVWSGTRSTDRSPVATGDHAAPEASDQSPSAHDTSLLRAPGPLVDLGAHDSIGDLRSALTDGVRAAAVSATPDDDVEVPSPESVSRCAGQIFELFPDEPLARPPAASGVATVDGSTMLVHEFDLTDGEHRALVSVTAPADCSPRSMFYLD